MKKAKKITKKQQAVRAKKQQTVRATWLRISLALFIIASLTLIVVAAVRNGQATERLSKAPAPAALVNLSEGGATISDLLVKKGQNVVWYTEDGSEHQLTLAPSSASAAGFSENVIVGNSGSYSYAFDQVGIFHYYDILHPEHIKGTITVTE